MSRPRVIAHRGSSLAFPEHTRAAYRAALAEGANGLECDVRLSQDLVLFLMHDSRVDATTAGTGLVGDRLAAELDELDMHSRVVRRSAARTPGVPTTAGVETGVLRLADLLALAAAAGRPVELAIETKHPARAGRRIEAAVLAELAAVPALRATTRIMSFSAGALRRLRALDPGIATVLLLPDLPGGRRQVTLPPCADHAGPSVRHLRRDPGLVARLQGTGHEVHVWTVDDDADIDLCVDLGVDVLISNRPGYVLRRLGVPAPAG